MKKIFVVNGFPGSGKTTFGEYVGKELTQRGIIFLHTSSIDPIKAILLPREQWDKELTMVPKEKWDEINKLKRCITDRDWDKQTKDVYWRGVMSDLKMLLLREMPEFIHQCVVRKISLLKEPCVVFVDIREPENINGFIKYCEVNTPEVSVESIFIESDKKADYDNYSDGSVENFNYDYRIDNKRDGLEIGDSLNKLRVEVARFCDLIAPKEKGIEVMI